MSVKFGINPHHEEKICVLTQAYLHEVRLSSHVSHVSHRSRNNFLLPVHHEIVVCHAPNLSSLILTSPYAKHPNSYPLRRISPWICLFVYSPCRTSPWICLFIYSHHNCFHHSYIYHLFSTRIVSTGMFHISPHLGFFIPF